MGNVTPMIKYVKKISFEVEEKCNVLGWCNEFDGDEIKYIYDELLYIRNI